MRILLVEDNPGDARLIKELLADTDEPFDLVQVGRLGEAMDLVAGGGFDVVLLDLSLPDAQGLETVTRMHVAATQLPIVVLTGNDDEDLAVRTVNIGAQDYLVKGKVEGRLLVRAMRYAVERKRSEESLRRLYHEQFARAQAEAAERRSRFLAEAGHVLASSLEIEATLASVARLAVPHFADCCIVDLFDDGGQLNRLAVAHADPEKEPVVRSALPGANDATDEGTRTEMLEPGKSRVIELGDGGTTNGSAPLVPALAETLRRLGFQSLIVAPLSARGRTLGAILLCATTARRYLQDDLALAGELADRAGLAVDNARLYREAQEAARARDDVVAIVSHDLRNPLFRIYAAAGELIELAPPDTHRFVEIIRRSAKHMNRLIQDLLEVTKIESGHLGLERARHDVAAVVREAVDMVAPLAAQKQIAIQDRCESLGALVLDKVRMVQVMNNLLDNAIKHSPPQGQIEVIGSDQGPEIWLSVRDNGAGISEEHLPRIFDRFWQARRRTGGGAGLGLAIARGIIEAHGGRIWVESRVGEGSKFTIAIPKMPKRMSAENNAVESTQS